MLSLYIFDIYFQNHHLHQQSPHKIKLECADQETALLLKNSVYYFFFQI